MSNSWHEPTLDGRWPIPHHSTWPDDIRVTTALAAQADFVKQDLVNAFFDSSEMRYLALILHPDAPPRMTLQSSRKYTRIAFPYVPGLLDKVRQVLIDHGLQPDPNLHRVPRDYMVEIATIRIGFPDETFIYGQPRALSDTTRIG